MLKKKPNDYLIISYMKKSPNPIEKTERKIEDDSKNKMQIFLP